MNTKPDLPPLRDIISAFNLGADKSLGQHFLLDLNLTAKIARAAGSLKNTVVLEIGPGPGGLTRALLETEAAHVIAIEKDERFVKALQPLKSAYPTRFTLVQADALKTSGQELCKAFPNHPVKIISNLPYNVGTPLLIQWLGEDPWPPWYDSLTLMFQKEVADRITAKPGNKTYGRLSVISQWRAHVEKPFDVPARAFTPPPKIDSSIVHLTPRQNSAPPGLCETIQRVTAAAFGQRRKMLRASLKSLCADPKTLLEKADIDGARRAEQLSVEEFVCLAEEFNSTL